jgi:hypothetical protein
MPANTPPLVCVGSVVFVLGAVFEAVSRGDDLEKRSYSA